MQYLRQKLNEGLARIARENPTLDFSVETPEVRAAEADVNAAGMRWYRFEGMISEVEQKFKLYEIALKRANNL
jgi:hypothetical protein